MERLIQCQMSLVSWGEKARFKRARVGLLRRGSSVYIAIFPSNSASIKLPVDNRFTELFPAAIRFKNLGKDLLIRHPSSEHNYNTMIRSIKILLKKEKFKQNGKSDTMEKFISLIPSFDSLRSEDIRSLPTMARLIAEDGQLERPMSHLDQLGPNFDPPNQQVQRRLGSIGPVHSSQQSSSLSAGGCAALNIGGVGSGIGACGGSMVPGDQIDLSQRKVIEQRYNYKKRELDNKLLKSITVSGLEKIPKQLWLRTSLQSLTLSHCNLTRFPKQLEMFADTLISLDLSHNMIEKVPRTFCCKMINLSFLDLNNNLIETLPIEIKFFRGLVKLNISNNRLRMLPSTFSDLKSLKDLNVANNNLSQLPAFRRQDIRLRQLDVSHNPLDGASHEANTFEVYPPLHDNYMNDAAQLGYHENIFSPSSHGGGLSAQKVDKFPKLFHLTMLRIVSSDALLKLASEEALPQTIISTMQKEIFKCYRCNKMSILPAYNSTDILDYVDQVETLLTTGNYRHGMTFMKLLCRNCFDNMSS